MITSPPAIPAQRISLQTRAQHAACLCLILLLQACASTSNSPIAASSDTIKPSAKLSIGPYSSFSGRLIVFDPKRRWQVSLDWQAATPDTGTLRLSHALSGTVVDFRWSGSRMQVRDNAFPLWRPIQQDELTQHGIVLPPRQLASILLNQTPTHFHQIKHNTWESMHSGSPIQVRWQQQLHTLTIIDVQQHRTAKLIIKSHADITRSR